MRQQKCIKPKIMLQLEHKAYFGEFYVIVRAVYSLNQRDEF